MDNFDYFMSFIYTHNIAIQHISYTFKRNDGKFVLGQLFSKIGHFDKIITMPNSSFSARLYIAMENLEIDLRIYFSLTLNI